MSNENKNIDGKTEQGDRDGEIVWCGNDNEDQHVTLYKKHVAENKSELGEFDAVIDSTDHISFYCNDCKQEVRITELILRKHNLEVIERDEKLLCLYFEFICTGCKRTDGRKMYINGPFPKSVVWK